MNRMVAAVSVSGILVALMWVIRFFEFSYKNYFIAGLSVVLFFLGGLLLKFFSPRIRFRKFFRLKLPERSDLFVVLWMELLLVSGSFLLNYLIGWICVQWDLQILPAFAGLEKEHFILSVLTVIILPSFFEEFYFRGAVLSSLRELKPHYAVLLSSLIFMLMHGLTPYFLTNFYAGLILGYLLYWTKSLPCVILAHFLNNVLSYVLYAYSEKLNVLDKDMFIVYVLILFWLLGVYKTLSLSVKRLKKQAAQDATVINEGARVWEERSQKKYER